MAKKKPALNTLTPEEYEKRLKKIILAGLGKAWMFWPPRAEVKRRCKDPNKPGWSICEKCKGSVEKIETDHIDPCVSPLVGLVSWDEYITRRFVFSATKLQGLCHQCHLEKSRNENKIRRGRIKNEKEN
jgi:hypothetical protein